eukprot:scaffold23647_cov51-Attheya_sp.AAC.6
MMKTAIVTTVLFLGSARPMMGFVPAHAPFVVRTGEVATYQSKMTEGIMHELEDLGEEIKPQIHKNVKGFEYTESLLHKLRLELRERDGEYVKEIKHLRKEVTLLLGLLQTDQTVVTELETQVHVYETENESVKELLGETMKLVGRRIGNGVNRVLYFLRLKKKKNGEYVLFHDE